MRSISGNVATVEDGNLINHYGMFVAHLETLFIKSCKKLYPSILDSFNSKERKYRLISNLKVIIHLICVACIKVSIET